MAGSGSLTSAVRQIRLRLLCHQMAFTSATSAPVLSADSSCDVARLMFRVRWGAAADTAVAASTMARQLAERLAAVTL